MSLPLWPFEESLGRPTIGDLFGAEWPYSNSAYTSAIFDNQPVGEATAHHGLWEAFMNEDQTLDIDTELPLWW